MDAKSCRICLDVDPLDDLFSPCKCRGSVKYVHRECLATWVKTTNNPESKKKCMMCHTEYIKSSLRTHALFNFCTTIDHNAFIIFCFNFSTSIGVGVVLVSTLFVDEIPNHKLFFYGLMICAVNSLLVLIEILYCLCLFSYYRLKFRPILPRMCQVVVSPTFLILVGFPIATVTKEISILILLSFVILLTLNIAVSMVFTALDKQIIDTHTSEILPYPVVEVEEKEATFVEIGEESVIAINQFCIPEQLWNSLEFENGMVLQGVIDEEKIAV